MIKSKIQTTLLLFITILLLMMIGSISTVFTYIAVVGCFLIDILIGYMNRKKGDANCVVGILLLLCFQNFMIGMGAHITENKSDSLKLITQIPFMTIAIIWCFIFFLGKGFYGIKKERRLFGLLLLCLAISFIVGRGVASAVLINIRNLTVFFMCFCIGYHCLNTEEKLIKFQGSYLYVSLVLLVAGIILLIGGRSLYEMIGINEVYSAKTSSIVTDAYSSGVFRTEILNRRFIRMGSLYYEPVNLGYLFSCSFLVAYFGTYTKSKVRKGMWCIITLLGLILTFGKGGYMVTITSFCGAYALKCSRKIRNFDKKLLANIIVAALIMFVGIFSVYYYRRFGGVVKQHFWGIIGTWDSILKKPIGYGLGVGGNAAKRFGALTTEWLSSGGETALMSYLYQLGIIGGLIFALSVLSLTVNTKTAINNSYFSLFLLIPAVLLEVSILQDNTFTPQCISMFMVLQGSAKKICAAV
jgi:hypothetical protein|nr:hypothetical protein [uncultured Acetatifactor sp.]